MNRLYVCILGFFIASSALASPLVGYGSSDAVLPAKNQELFFMGFELGFKNTLNPKKYPGEVLITDQVTDRSQLGALASANRLAVIPDLSMIVGYPTSHEALLAAKVLKSKNILTIFCGAGHSDLATFGPSIYTTGESMKQNIDLTVSFIKRKFKGKKGILIGNPSAVFSKNFNDEFLGAVKKESDVFVSEYKLQTDLTLPPADLLQIQNSKYSYVIVSAYADESVNLLKQLEGAHLDLPIISNSSWTTGDVDFVRRFLTRRKSPVYSFSLFLEQTSDYRRFRSLVKTRYGREPTTEIAHGYDLGVISATTMNSVLSVVNRESVLQAFHKLGCVSGLAVGKMCFSAKGGYAQRSLYVVEFTKSGFIQVK